MRKQVVLCAEHPLLWAEGRNSFLQPKQWEQEVLMKPWGSSAKVHLLSEPSLGE